MEAADLRVGARLVEQLLLGTALNYRIGAVYCTFIFTRAAGWGGWPTDPNLGIAPVGSNIERHRAALSGCLNLG